MGEAIIVLYCRAADLTPEQTRRVLDKAMQLDIFSYMSWQIDNIIEEERY